MWHRSLLFRGSGYRKGEAAGSSCLAPGEAGGFQEPRWPGHVCELREPAGGCPGAEGAHLDNHSPPALTKGSSTTGIKVHSAWTATSHGANSREPIQNILYDKKETDSFKTIAFSLMSETLHQCFAKAHQVIWFEKHHISTFWLSNMLFSKMIIFMQANSSKGRIRRNNTSYPSPISCIIRMVISNTKCNLHFSQHWGKGALSAEQFHYLISSSSVSLGSSWPRPCSCLDLVSAFTLARPRQEAHEQRSSEMEITHELLMQTRRGQSK